MSQDETEGNIASRDAPNGSDKIFGRRLRVLREASDLTQQEVADNASDRGTRLHRSTVAKIEAGERVVSFAEAIALADVLGVQLQDLAAEPRGTDWAAASAERRSLERQVRMLAEERIELTERLIAVNDALAMAEPLLEAARRKTLPPPPPSRGEN